MPAKQIRLESSILDVSNRYNNYELPSYLVDYWLKSLLNEPKSQSFETQGNKKFNTSLWFILM